LIDFGREEVKPDNNRQKHNDQALLSQLQFDNNSMNQQTQNQDAYIHNQQIFNNLNIDFGDDSDEENYPPNNLENYNQFDNNNDVNFISKLNFVKIFNNIIFSKVPTITNDYAK